MSSYKICLCRDWRVTVLTVFVFVWRGERWERERQEATESRTFVVIEFNEVETDHSPQYWCCLVLAPSPCPACLAWRR